MGARRTTSVRPFSLISELDLSFWLVNGDFSIAGQPEGDGAEEKEEEIQMKSEAIGFYGRGG